MQKIDIDMKKCFKRDCDFFFWARWRRKIKTILGTQALITGEYYR